MAEHNVQSPHQPIPNPLPDTLASESRVHSTPLPFVAVTGVSTCHPVRSWQWWSVGVPGWAPIPRPAPNPSALSGQVLAGTNGCLLHPAATPASLVQKCSTNAAYRVVRQAVYDWLGLHVEPLPR